jgi:hypothetical protein
LAGDGSSATSKRTNLLHVQTPVAARNRAIVKKIAMPHRVRV